jgi:branched-chain amino acid transport system permease protein
VPACRFKGDPFVLISLAVQQMLLSTFQNWSTPGAAIGTWANMTNGPFGISSIPKPFLAGFHAEDLPSMAVLSLLVCGLCGAIAWFLLSSPWARLLVSMRDDELATRGLGKDVRLSKIQAVAISCGMAAIAGCLYASYVNYVDPTAGSLDESMLILCMVLVGGIGNFRGPLVGALLLILIPEVLRFTTLPDSIAASVRLIVYGVLLVGLMHVRPQGIAGAYKVG